MKHAVHYFFLSVLFLLAQAGFLNMLGRGPLVVWKQLLLLSLFILAAMKWSGIRARLGEVQAIRSLPTYVVMIGLGMFILIAWSFLRGVSAYGIAYTTFLYVGGMPFVVLPIVALLTGRVSLLLRALMLMGLISGVGLIVDYYYNVYDLTARYLPVNADFYRMILLQREFGFVRAQFFFESTNTVVPFMTLSLMACMARLWLRSRDALAIVSMVAILAGLMFTGQRSVFILTLAFGMFSALSIIKISRGYFLPIFLGVIVCIALVGAVAFAFRSGAGIDQEVIQRYLNPFDQAESANQHRYSRWREGFALLTGSNPADAILGRGLGLTVTALQTGMVYQTHYESSFFMTFYEAGLTGLLIRYAPLLLALAVMLRRKLAAPMDLLLLPWVVCCLLATLTSPNIGSFHVQSSMWLVLGLALISPWIQKAESTQSDGLNSLT